ncbi:MAG: DUF5689 domain-containing protein [Prevotella sp.]|nr:DUF5689 domain-containing protein [Prevotella sp.]
MKTTHYIYIMALAVVGGLFTSCMDSGWKEPELTALEAGIGNAAIAETNVVSIADLKNKYRTLIETDYRDGDSFTQVTEDMQIKAVVTGNDIEGNIYNEIALDDGTGAIIVAISQGGLFSILPVGAEIIIDLKGLYVGNYGKQAEIGVPYTNSSGLTYVSRMNQYLWSQHFKPTGQTKVIEPIEYSISWRASTNGLQYGGKLVTLKNVSFKGADGTATYANAGAGPGSKNVYFNEYSQSSIMLYNSNFADFAANPLPTGKVNVTGILKRYNNTWEVILRTLDDVEVVK